MFSSAHPATQPTTMHCLLRHTYGAQERRIFIIPHRLKNQDESKSIISRVEKTFWNTIKERKLQESDGVLQNSLMLSELIELLLQVFQESEYIYNQDVFLGIDFQLDTKQDENYIFDELAEDADPSMAVRYYLQIANSYNPLMILNPFGLHSESSYHALTQDIGDTTLVGQAVKENDLTSIKKISDNIHGHCVVLDSLKDLVAIKQLKLKTIVDSSRLTNKIPFEDLKKSEADFIIS